MLEYEFDRKSGILYVSIIGDADFDELQRFIPENYPEAENGVLWDLTNGNMSTLSKNQLHRLISTVKNVSRHKQTAYVGSQDLQFGLLRMYESWAEMNEVAPIMSVFRNREEADKWLKKE